MTKLFEIDRFRLDPAAGVLTLDGRPTPLGSRAVAVLATLVRSANDYVPKGAIIDAAWPGVVVEEHNLAVQISAIRRVLAQAGGEHWIETIARRGYRFVGPVIEITDSRQATAEARSNLPAALTSFVGRERELVEIKRLLANKRLVTLVGIGGIGKTRLALQAAAEVVDAYRDGVWLAELGSIRDPALVAGAVAQALGVQDRTNARLVEALKARMRWRQMLLVLDNCEHLLEACARLVDTLLREAADATIIATSREALRVTGEQIYPLQPLSLPERDAVAEKMVRSEAVQLFVERARDQLPDFALTAERAPAVAALCVHLDGIPLALELAAARARSLSIDQINARLGDRFRLLTRGSRSALPHQQTLRATLDWSGDLLTEHERTVLRRLAIFPASFTAEDIAAVASDASMDEFAAIDLASHLVARSLVICDTTGHGTRYRLLETMRAYALEKLTEAGEAIAITQRHAQYLRDSFERAHDDWLRMPDVEWSARYGPRLADVRAALDWALGSGGDAEVGIALAGASGPLWVTTGLFREGVRRLESAAAAITSQTPEADQARLWGWLGRLLDEEPVKARPVMERAIELYRRVNDPLWLGITLVRWSKVLAFMGKFEESEAVLAESRPLLERAGSRRALSFYFFNLAFLKSNSGDFVAARANYEQALALNRETGYQFGVLSALNNLANVTWWLGDLEATEDAFRQTVAHARASPVSTRRMLGWSLGSLACVLTEQGRLDEALEAAREGLPLLAADGSAWIFVGHLALRTALAGKLADAARLAGYSEHMLAAKQATHHPLDARARDRLLALLREKLGAGELERLLADGAKMGESEAHGLVLEISRETHPA